MNEITELIDILSSLGGKAYLSEIVKAYGKRHRMVIQPSHKSVIKRTLINSPNLVAFNGETEMWYLPVKTTNTESKDPISVKSGDVRFLRDTAYNWADGKCREGELLEVYGNRGQRQIIITPRIAQIVPRVAGKEGISQSGYYCGYEIEIRPQKAVVRLMATVTEDTPSTTIQIYKEILLPSINKTYREGGRFYNKTFSSMNISQSTTNTDIIDMMEDAFRKITVFENSINLDSQMK